MYSFLFDRRSMALLLTGMAAGGLLLFAGGVFVGLQLQLQGTEPVTVAEFRPLGASAAAAPLEPDESATPAQPAAPAELPAPGSEAPAESAPPAEPAAPAQPPSEPALVIAAAPPVTGTPRPATEPPATELPASALPTPELPATGLPEQTIVLAREEPQPEPGRAAVRDESTPAAAAVPASLPSPAPARTPAIPVPTVDESVPVLSHRELVDEQGEPTFGVQVAAFELRATASRIAAELVRRGWDAYLVPFTTPSGRQMYSIRFGRFGEAAEAYRAARDFERQERMPTLVRLQLADG